MTRGVRKWLFYALVAIFLIVGATVVLYAEGWRINPATGKITKVGAVFVRSYPADASIFLNGTPIKNSSGFFGAGTLMSNLFPGPYTVMLKANGYDDWSEPAEVLPSLVTTFKYAVLVPREGVPVATSGTVKRFLDGTNGDLLLQTAAGNIVWQGNVLGNGTLLDFGAERALARSAQGTYRLYDLRNGTTTNLTALLRAGGADVTTIQTIKLDPSSPGTVTAGTKTRLWSADVSTKKISLLATATSGSIFAPEIAIGPSLLAWETLDTSGNTNIVIYDKGAQAVVKSIQTKSAVKKMDWMRDGLLGALQDNGSFGTYDVPGGILQELATSTRDFFATGDGAMAALVRDRQLEILSLNAKDRYKFTLEDIANVNRIIWYRDKSHLFMVYGDHVSFLDLADTGLHNLTTVAEGTEPLYDPGANALYMLGPAHNILRFDFPQ